MDDFPDPLAGDIQDIHVSRPLLLVTLKHWQRYTLEPESFSTALERASEDDDSPRNGLPYFHHFLSISPDFSCKKQFHLSSVQGQFWKSSQVIFHNYGQELEVLKVEGMEVP